MAAGRAKDRKSEFNCCIDFSYKLLSGRTASCFEKNELIISDKFSFDLPSINSQTEWENLKNQLLTNAGRFCDKVEQFEDDQLDNSFINEKYGTLLRNIEGVIEHSYYHLGQTVLIKKMIREEANTAKNKIAP